MEKFKTINYNDARKQGLKEIKEYKKIKN